MNKDIIGFYRGFKKDHRGRSIDDYHNMDYHDMEFTHDFIQWMFPSPIKSKCSSSAPNLTADDVVIIMNDIFIWNKITKSIQKYLDFIGIKSYIQGSFDGRHYIHSISNLEVPKFTEHNVLRISRMFVFLNAIGRRYEAYLIRNAINLENFAWDMVTCLPEWRKDDI